MKKYSTLIVLSLLWFGLGIVSYFYFDLPAMKSLFALHLDSLHGSLLWYLTRLGFGLYVILATLGLIVVSLLFIRRRAAVIGSVYLLFSVLLSSLLCDLLKVIFGRYRPSLYTHLGDKLYGFSFSALSHQHPSRYESFPSGHTTSAAALAIGVCLLLPKLRIPAILYMLMIAATRVLRLNHYISDVMAGMYLGAIVSLLLYRVFYQRVLQSQFLSKVEWIKQ